MDAYIKNFSDFRNAKRLSVLSSSMVVDSLEAESSTVVVAGTAVTHKNTGDWLILGDAVYRISAVTPQADRTSLTLSPPLEAFTRPLELTEQAAEPYIGGFICQAMQKNWTEGSDPAYAAPYLVVSNSDTTPYVTPEVDNSGCFNLADYCRLMRKSYHITVRFKASGNSLICSIERTAVAARQISFEDGRSQLQKASYSAAGIAKLTVLCDTDTGEKDTDGNKIIVRTRSDWYLSEAGDITQEVPVQRAAGAWKTIKVSGTDDIQAKVIEAFAKNKSSHKLEFWSTRDLAVQDTCTFCIYGELLTSYISYKRKSSNDTRFYYKSGELATTATEKLRGVTK